MKANQTLEFAVMSESGFSHGGRERPKGHSEVAADKKMALKGEQKGATPQTTPLKKLSSFGILQLELFSLFERKRAGTSW